MLRKRQDDWAYILQVIRVTRYREEIRKSKSTQAVHYYVSNHHLKAFEYAKYICEHWWTKKFTFY